MYKIFIILLSLLLLSSCTPKEEEKKLIAATIALNWFPEAEHGGFYAALVHGYYEAEGLEVKIIPGGPGNTSLQQVAQENYDFGVTNADGLLMICAQEAKLDALMAPIQKSPRSIMVHYDAPIQNLHDIKNMNLIISPVTTFSAYMKKKLALEGVNIVQYKGSIAPFLIDKNSAQQAYIFSEPFIAESQGVKVRNLLIAEELDYNPYTSILVTHDNKIKQNSQVVAKIVKASQKGWLKYLEDPEETNKYINTINPEMKMDILTYGVKVLTPLVNDGLQQKNDLGIMSIARWQKILSQMKEAEVIKNDDAIDISKVFTNDFLPDK